MGPPRATLPLLWFGDSMAAMLGEGHRIQVEVNRGSKWPLRRRSQKEKEDEWIEFMEDGLWVTVSAHLSK